MNRFAYSPKGLALTREFEGLKLSAYLDPIGIWTIGFGHTGPDVHNGLTITSQQAEHLLESDLASAVHCVNRAVTSTINQNQFDALVDFTFNLGACSLLSSTLLRCINSGDFASAAPEFLRWDHACGKVLPGLLARRQAEMQLFES